MKIHGIDGMTLGQLQNEIAQGGKFVIFPYCISLVVVSFRRSSGIYFIPAGKSRFLKSLPWTAISLVLGWWGIPWGIIYTLGCLGTNIGGGKNVTDAVLMSITQQAPAPAFDFETAAPVR